MRFGTGEFFLARQFTVWRVYDTEYRRRLAAVDRTGLFSAHEKTPKWLYDD